MIACNLIPGGNINKGGTLKQIGVRGSTTKYSLFTHFLWTTTFFIQIMSTIKHEQCDVVWTFWTILKIFPLLAFLILLAHLWVVSVSRGNTKMAIFVLQSGEFVLYFYISMHKYALCIEWVIWFHWYNLYWYLLLFCIKYLCQHNVFSPINSVWYSILSYCIVNVFL